MSLWSFQGARGTRARTTEKTEAVAGTGLSKLNSVRDIEVDVCSRRAELPDGLRHLKGSAPTGVKSSGFPRKEVIQPQLPLRLPCYDFTPIIDPTFDGSLPCGLGHRLRVLPTFVV